ncbi:MAG: hypothetical protein ACQES8_09615, partial [Thermodesulfobacteriota bacterium]
PGEDRQTFRRDDVPPSPRGQGLRGNDHIIIFTVFSRFPMFQIIRALLAKEMGEIDRTAAICQNRMARLPEFTSRNEEDILADSLAACLHSVYSGIEGLFKTIALEIDGGSKTGINHGLLLISRNSES